jgi:hypothetical protein
LKQVALAIHNYADANESRIPTLMHSREQHSGTPLGSPLPSPGSGNNTLIMDISVNLILCPFIEQTALYSTLMGHAWFTSVTLNGTDSARGYTQEFVNIHQNAPVTFRCPSDGHGQRMDGHGNSGGGTNIVFCVGDHQTNRGIGQRTTDTGGTMSRPSNRGIFDSRGGRGDRITIPDGTSNTVALSECVRPNNGWTFGANAIFTFAENQGDSAEPGVDPALAMATHDRQNRTYRAPAVRSVGDDGVDNLQRGYRWLDGSAMLRGFSTVIPPNAGSFAYPTAGTGNWALGTASSYHQGGVNAAMLDGVVRFVSDTINARTPGLPDYNLPGNTQERNAHGRLVGPFSMSGPSKYGVWGGLGTKEGGESVSL